MGKIFNQELFTSIISSIAFDIQSILCLKISLFRQGMGLLPTLQRRMSTLSRQDSKGNAAKSEDRLSLQHNSYLKKSYFTDIKSLIRKSSTMEDLDVPQPRR